MDRKKRFLSGLVVLVVFYSVPLSVVVAAGQFSLIGLVFGCFVFSVYLVYRLTIGNVKLKYPIVSPEGHPDAYTGRIPRPLYEDMERYPWFFRKKREKKLDKIESRKR